MILLLFSDLHCDDAAARRLVELSATADVVVGAGDFATCRRDVHKTLDVLQQINKPAVLVPGNAESFEELQAAAANWESAYVLHGGGTTVAGVPFWGLGGAVPVTPFGDWSYDFTEEQAAEMLDDCPTGGVLVSHSPPKGVLDRNTNGDSLGSEAVRNAIVEKKPKLVVCGHIHACASRQESVNRTTTVVNAGPAGLLWEL